MRLLLVEDKLELRDRLSSRLREVGFAVDCISTVDEAQHWPDLDRINAVILDLGLPDGDGMSLLQHWRGNGEAVPILILTARGSWQEKVDGLNAGADDFVVKPVRFEELLARLHAVVRRRSEQQSLTIRHGKLALVPTEKLATLEGKSLDLTKKEFALLQMFIRRPGYIFSQADIIEHIYALENDRNFNAIEALISRLRRKTGSGIIATVRGFGYKLET
jgi:two-component system, OmpR family, response regulator